MKILKSALALSLIVLTALAAVSCKSFTDKGIKPVAEAVFAALGEEYDNADSPVDLNDTVACTYASFSRESADQVPDRVAIYRTDTVEDAERTETECKKYLSGLQDPDNVKFVGSYDLVSAEKLKSAKVVRYENYVIVCVTDAKTIDAVKSAAESVLYE